MPTDFEHHEHPRPGEVHTSKEAPRLKQELRHDVNLKAEVALSTTYTLGSLFLQLRCWIRQVPRSLRP